MITYAMTGPVKLSAAANISAPATAKILDNERAGAHIKVRTLNRGSEMQKFLIALAVAASSYPFFTAAAWAAEIFDGGLL